MKKNGQTEIDFQLHNNQEYPDVIASEEPEEENPMAYTLLTKIEDPYYAKSENSAHTQSAINEGNKH